MFAALLLSTVQSMYFYLDRGQEYCFKDEVVKNYVSLLFEQIMSKSGFTGLFL